MFFRRANVAGRFAVFLLRPPGEKLAKFGHYALGTTLAA
jgi:hypothetical protein